MKSKLNGGEGEGTGRHYAYSLLLCTALVAVLLFGCGGVYANPSHPERAQTIPAAATETYLPIVKKPKTTGSRGYLTTPQELSVIAAKARQGIEPYKSAVAGVIGMANEKWDYDLDKKETCPNSDKPRWNDDNEGTPRLYARALAFHLTGEERYAEEVRDILERIMSKVIMIDLGEQQCRLNFGWGTPELVASADLIDEHWAGQTCKGPLSTLYEDTEIGSGECKELFQNWLVKNPYYVTSLSAANSNSNWGAAATTTTAYIADYLWDRPGVKLLHREPSQINNGEDKSLSPSEAYQYANQIMLERMNGHRIEYGSSDSCDYLSGSQQSANWAPVKSQITEKGIIPEDARREEYCNIPQYNGKYQNYPQIHLGNNIQQCELMLRRGDRRCFDNVEMTEIANFTFTDPKGAVRVTHLYPGRGSIERAINAVIVDSGTPWKHDEALEVAYRYYYANHTLPGFDEWEAHLTRRAAGCSQDLCFTTLTHGFAKNETPELPPAVSPP